MLGQIPPLARNCNSTVTAHNVSTCCSWTLYVVKKKNVETLSTFLFCPVCSRSSVYKTWIESMHCNGQSHFQNYNSRQLVLKHLSVKSCLPPAFTKILRETNMKFATRQAASVALCWCLQQQHKGFLRLRLLFRKNLRLPVHFRKVGCDSSKVTVGTFTVFQF